MYSQRFDALANEPVRQPRNVSGNGATFLWLPRIALAPREASAAGWLTPGSGAGRFERQVK